MENEVDITALFEKLRNNEELAFIEGEEGIVSSDIIADFIKNLGFDGVVMTNPAERFRGMGLGTGTSHIHIFNEHNHKIKLADGSNTSFDEATSDIRFKRTVLQPDHFKYRQNIDKMLYQVQDMFIDLKRLQEGKKKAGGILADFNDAYQAQNLSYGKIKAKHDNFFKSIGVPLVEHLVDIQNEHGLDLAEAQAYLKSKHAIERNAKLAKDNQEKIEKLQLKVAAARKTETKAKYQAELLDLQSLSGITDKDANDIISQVQDRVPEEKLNKLHDLVRSMSNFILDTNVESGRITTKRAEDLKTLYDHYVPLRGFADADYDPTMFAGSGGRGFGNSRKAPDPTGRAKGRKSESGDPLPYLFVMAQDAIVKGEQNKVKQTLLEFVRSNPDQSIYEIKNSWWVQTDQLDSDGKPIWTEVHNKPKKSLFEKGKAKKHIDPENESPTFTKFTEDSIDVAVDGEKVTIIFKNSNIAKAFKNADVEKTPVILQHVSNYTRFLSKMYTQYSPEFVLRNFLRDMTAGMINIRNDYGTATAAKVFGRVSSALNTLQKAIYSDNYSGKMGQLFKEFEDTGAMTGYSSLQDVTSFQKDLEEEIKKAQGGNIGTKTLEGFKWMMGGIDMTNRIVENAIRFAAFVELRNQGHSKEKAAFYAKDLTVNFNRKGVASSSIGSLYLFFNAAVQGSERVLRPFFGEDKKVRNRAFQTLLALPVLNAILGMLNRLYWDKDEDDRYFYDKLSDYERNHNLIFSNILPDAENKFFMIPLPYGFNSYFALGDHAVRALIGEETPIEAAINTFSTVFGSFSPLGSPDFTGDDMNLLKSTTRILAPTPVEPFVDLSANNNFAGSPIYPQQFPGQVKPDSEQYFKGVNPLWKEAAQGLNKITGGDNRQSGALDFSPETFEHLFGTLAGGVGKFVFNVSDVAIKVGTQQYDLSPENVKKTPFLRNFVAGPTTYSDRSTYFDNIRKVEEVEKILDGYEKDRNLERYREYRQENLKYVKLFKITKNFDKQVKKVRDRIEIVEGRPESPENRKMLDDLMKKEHGLYKRYNKLFNNEKVGMIKLNDILK
jgi:hypothetical protein